MLGKAETTAVKKVSTIIETDPVGYSRQGKFLNCVAEIETDLSPHALLNAINDIERDLGRTRSVKNGPRTIDLDILLYDNITLNDEDLKIPHPGLTDRQFVMIPLREIAPHLEVCRR